MTAIGRTSFAILFILVLLTAGTATYLFVRVEHLEDGLARANAERLKGDKGAILVAATLSGPDCRLYENDAAISSALRDVGENLHEVRQVLYEARVAGYPGVSPQPLPFISTTCPS